MDDPLRTLAGDLADRRAVTQGEWHAARWLTDRCRRHAHQVWLEPFDSFRTARPGWLLILGLSLLGGSCLWFAPGAAITLSLLAALAFATQALGWLELGWLFPTGESQNVVSVTSARGEIRKRLVVVAHYDTGPRLWSWSGFVAVALGVMLLPPAVITAVMLLSPLGKLMALLPLIGVMAGITALVRSDAELGNDAGVAAALAVVQGASLEHTEVWTLFTGACTPGMVGIRSFLFRHGRLLADAQFVVLEEERGGAPLWQQRGEASIIAALGWDSVTLLTLPSADVLGAASRVRTIAEWLDREACEERGA